MTPTIAYDKPVENMIDQLSATGHVTHTAYKKTSVTLHHNAGRLSHQGVLNAWKTRAASAHFDSDGTGAIAQYVKVNEYAWAVGNKSGNQSSISIEMANSTMSPKWEVADATWKGAARLAGWLFAKVIGARPSKSNFFYHHHWSSTACAGPYMDKVYDDALKEAQTAYDSFTKPKQPKPPILPPTKTSAPPSLSITKVAQDVIAGKYGNGPDRTRRLIAAHYSPSAVQAEVNKLLGDKNAVTHVPTRKSVKEMAAEVIAGKWGNGPDRTKRLAAAGYNPSAIQREVNLRLK
jgi:CW_7 repeat/N-acetylmuramoyl-L-alanine amidase